ncbi:hypothetical protein [Croceimicrobium hydrocarbonivorans]|uniref:Integral membrane protein n=1 Tax=Croceimicrobium hydrocarbonivorans TaxID=2761580 RepID=A0A7H0VDQ8_9FLAO|nr:hypothetical protein [Croceimicrobium hydrocarbonivorans]QNR23856.1 hypothetical protein H4K34_15990 [Croceimicrobium hydrocarbonivorans]
MKLPEKSLLNKVITEPQRAFLIDGLGAMASALLLGLLLPSFEEFFGVPSDTLYCLASIPLFYAVYDWGVYLIKPKRIDWFLILIALLNLAYCGLSFKLIFQDLSSPTIYGKLYFGIEIGLVFILGCFELYLGLKKRNRL